MANDLYLAHHGIKGQRWGVRRFQNPDGSLTEAGQKRQAKEDAWRTKKSAKLTLMYVKATRRAQQRFEKRLTKMPGKQMKLIDKQMAKKYHTQRKIAKELYEREMENLSRITPGEYNRTAVARFVGTALMGGSFGMAGHVVSYNIGLMDRPTEVSRKERREIINKYKG